MLTDALNDERRARQEQLAELINTQREQDEFKRNAYRMTQAQNWHNIAQRLEGAMINNNARKQTCMAYYKPLEFSGLLSKDLEEHIHQWRLFLGGAEVNNDYAGKIQALNIWLAKLKGRAREWYNDVLAGKNWALHHVNSRVNVADIAAAGAVPALPNMPGVQLLPNADNAGIGIGISLINTPSQAGYTGAQIIPIDDFHIDQNWTFAKGCLTNTPHNFPSANNANPIVIPLDINYIINWFQNYYPIEVRGQQKVIYSTLTKGNRPINIFYWELEKYSWQLGITDHQKRLQFLRGIPPENKIEVKRIGLNRSLTELPKQVQVFQSMQNDPNSEAVKLLVVAMKRAKKTLTKESDPSKKKADQIHSDRFLLEGIIKNMGDDPSDFHDEDDPVEEMRRQIEDLHINQTKMGKDIKKIASKPKSTTTRKKKTGEKSKSKSTSKIKSKKKKKSGSFKRINSHSISDESSSDSGSDSEKSDSEDELETNALALGDQEASSESSESELSSSSDSESSKKRKKTSSKKSSKTSPSDPLSTKKSSKDTKSLKIPTDNIILNAFFAILRLMVDSFIHAQPREVSINTWNMINAEFIGLKDPILSHYISNFSEKERNKFWNGITIQTSLPQNVQQPVASQPPFQVEQQPIQMNQLIGPDISWPNPMKINFIQKIIPNDVTTIRCKISSPLKKIVQMPSALIDSDANCSVLLKGLIKLLGADIDKNKKPPVK
ncbi:hypothetical protein GLOIN_2v1482738 [Rhizophagus clarus]|uniref:Uncharacterized protein n=1 Tax=Rhizophagus clarus TaxID=94130 RepID=A0A8H3QYJ2_9GLOM|nr:hypothetical protein GLOIN_2v1482738 [Rhizophagus clarus]